MEKYLPHVMTLALALAALYNGASGVRGGARHAQTASWPTAHVEVLERGARGAQLRYKLHAPGAGEQRRVVSDKVWIAACVGCEPLARYNPADPDDHQLYAERPSAGAWAGDLALCALLLCGALTVCNSHLAQQSRQRPVLRAALTCMGLTLSFTGGCGVLDGAEQLAILSEQPTRRVEAVVVDTRVSVSSNSKTNTTTTRHFITHQFRDNINVLHQREDEVDSAMVLGDKLLIEYIAPHGAAPPDTSPTSLYIICVLCIGLGVAGVLICVASWYHDVVH